ncbi:hypothetical protein PG997_006851 [Apiospora hydei]|uniref:Integral membrane protein n=1 Tax=Apiospora hydei TaxID=1337664 RepID=A0ABR1WRW0_9PEZI
MSPHAPSGPRRRLGRCLSHALHIRVPVSFLNPTAGFVAVSRSGGRAATRSPYRHSVESGRRNSLSPTPSNTNGRTTTTDGSATAAAAEKPSPGTAYHVWQTRNNRKGRHAVAVRVPSHLAGTGLELPKATNTPRQILSGIRRMAVRYPVWDVSYDVAIMFTIGKLSLPSPFPFLLLKKGVRGRNIISDEMSFLGSVIWVINAFFVWLPLQTPSTAFANETSLGGGITAFIGATVFELGSVLLMLEAVNENRTDCFGWALEREAKAATRSAEGGAGDRLRLPTSGLFSPLPKSRKMMLTAVAKRNSKERGRGNGGPWNELATHYFREIGFLACLAQFVGATVFWISGFTGLPPIFDALSTPAANGIFWLPQVVGGTGFIVSGCLFMLEVQPSWYRPAPKVLGWHVGLWNLVGALGFTVCGALGFAIGDEGVEYASTLATFVGSWAFLVGSVIQWYESLDKYPLVLSKSISTIPHV